MEESTCKVTFNAQSDSYKEVSGFKCGQGLTCANFEDTGANDVEFAGVCKPKKCFGEGPAHRKDDKDDGDAVTGTHRVTICHRTCSETNPWVRITIDDDAWNTTMCGHSTEHDVRIDCNNKTKDFEIWAPHYKDYVLKWHGTHEDVRKKHGWTQNCAEEKAYWREWEHACPYVRNGKCCQAGDCCGENPDTNEAPPATTEAPPEVLPTTEAPPSTTDEAPAETTVPPPTTDEAPAATTAVPDADSGGDVRTTFSERALPFACNISF